MTSLLLTVEIRNEPDISFVRQRARQLAGLLGFDAYDQTRICTAVSEIARNAYLYARGGCAQFSIEGHAPARLAIRIRDHGPGISNLNAILAGCSESRTGMGAGLLGAQKLMDRFHIDTSAEGTTVELCKALPVGAPKITPELVARIVRELEKVVPTGPAEEIRQQNRELLHALEALRHHAALTQTIINLAPLGVYTVDAEFLVRAVNPVALAVFGDIPGGVIGRDFGEIIHVLREKSHAGEVVRIFRRTLETGEPYITPECAEYRIDRNITEYYEWRLDRITLADGKYGVVSYFRDISAQVQARKHRELLINELNHRVKNTLATVQSFAAQSLRNANTLPEARAIFDSRLVALAKAHDLLNREHWEGAGLHEIVADALAAYSGGGQACRFRTAGQTLRPQPKAALALSMALHELATNALKYGALSNDVGTVEVGWLITQDDPQYFRLRWAESGGPPVERPRRRGFGSRLIEQGLAQDLGGEVRLDFERPGVLCTIDAPLAEVVGGGGDGQP